MNERRKESWLDSLRAAATEDPLGDIIAAVSTEGDEAQRGAPAGDDEADGAPVPAVAEEPTVAPGEPHDAERERLLEQRAMLVERRRVIMFGSARDAYGREIARVDRLLALLRRQRTP